LLNQKDWLARTVESVKRHANQTAKKCTRMKNVMKIMQSRSCLFLF
jgi:hypothetical protein